MDDPIIYHYTSPDGLIGILREGQLRATSIRHFEDKTELLYAETIHENVLNEIEAQYSPNSLESGLARACRIEPRPTPPRAGPLSPGSGKRRPWLNEVLDIFVSWCVLKDANFSRVKVPSGQAPEHPVAGPSRTERSHRPQRGVKSL